MLVCFFHKYKVLCVLYMEPLNRQFPWRTAQNHYTCKQVRLYFKAFFHHLFAWYILDARRYLTVLQHRGLVCFRSFTDSWHWLNTAGGFLVQISMHTWPFRWDIYYCCIVFILCCCYDYRDAVRCASILLSACTVPELYQMAGRVSISFLAIKSQMTVLPQFCYQIPSGFPGHRMKEPTDKWLLPLECYVMLVTWPLSVCKR